MPFDATPNTRAHTDCLLCPVTSCMARRNGGDHAQAWSEVLAPRTAVMPGASPLFNTGDRQQAVYTVRGGCIKTYTVDADGNERIRGFFLPGDLIGLDGLGCGVHLSNAAAVTASQVCVAPVGGLRTLMQSQPALAQRVLEQTSRELAHALAMSGDFSAEQRLAAFLLNMRDRLGAGGTLRLPMGQRDIGSYLRLATETVCRTLKSFERRGWLSLGDRSIRLLNEPKLGELAEAVGIVSGKTELARAA
ncbi:MAG: helix-turn-helix domain-containing protein [Nevskia sp.]|nr:helix-turn-helix domain-containing protein [Nevskia sp.]